MGFDAELLAPAGDFATALAAFDAGADAVYCGLADFSARAYAKNLSPEELENLMRAARARGKKVYVTFNTLVSGPRMEKAVRSLALLERIGPDALIVQDAGVAALCRKHFPSLALHASTQMAVHNLEGVEAMAELGFRRVVLARELPFAEIASIVRRCGETEIECFIHGALCYSVSGLCLFSAMERGRSGNCGECAYCCRGEMECEGGPSHPFSMKDLRLGPLAAKLAQAGVASLKIEGRMKSLLYVASAVRYYRQLLDEAAGLPPPPGETTTADDLETVFSRRTTTLYFDGYGGAKSPVDPGLPGHLGAPAGVAKRVTRDREGRPWLRFRAARALELHDGLQISPHEDGRRTGFGIVEMCGAISRRRVFSVPAGADVEVLIPEDFDVRPGDALYCSMSNAVKRRFPEPAFRPAAHPGRETLVVDEVEITRGRAVARSGAVAVEEEGDFPPAENASGMETAARKAFSRLGGTRFGLCDIKTFSNREGVYAPAAAWNSLRRKLVEKLDAAAAAAAEEKIRRVLEDEDASRRASGDEASGRCAGPRTTMKMRCGQKPTAAAAPDETVVAPAADGTWSDGIATDCRIALPPWTDESDFPKLRASVKKMLHRGYHKWEAADFATLRMLRALGVEDVTADWTLSAANPAAMALLSSLGVRRFTASPEWDGEAREAIARSGFAVDFLSRQCTPLFLSLSAPAARPAPESGYAAFRCGRLWATVALKPKIFEVPAGCAARTDYSWDPQC